MREAHSSGIAFPVLALDVGRVAGVFQEPGQRVRRVELLRSEVVVDACLMRPTAAEKAGQRRMAARHRQVRAGEHRPRLGQPIEIRRVHDRGAHETQVLVVMVVGNDEHDVWLLGVESGRQWRGGNRGKQDTNASRLLKKTVHSFTSVRGRAFVGHHSSTPHARPPLPIRRNTSIPKRPTASWRPSVASTKTHLEERNRGRHVDTKAAASAGRRQSIRFMISTTPSAENASVGRH